MTLRESLFSALTAGSPPARVYPPPMPQNPVLPAIVCMIFFHLDEEDLVGNDNHLVNAHVQLDAYATTEKAADAAADAARLLLLSAPDFTARSIGGSDQYEPDTRLYRVMREFSVWKTQ